MIFPSTAEAPKDHGFVIRGPSRTFPSEISEGPRSRPAIVHSPFRKLQLLPATLQRQFPAQPKLRHMTPAWQRLTTALMHRLEIVQAHFDRLPFLRPHHLNLREVLPTLLPGEGIPIVVLKVNKKCQVVLQPDLESQARSIRSREGGILQLAGIGTPMVRILPVESVPVPIVCNVGFDQPAPFRTSLQA